MFFSLPDPPLAPRDPNRTCRTLPVEAVAAPIAPTSSKSNPFGDAKPITDEERERRMQAAKVRRARLMTSQQFIPKPKRSSACPPSLESPLQSYLKPCLQAEREKFAAAAPAPAKERSPPPARKDGPGPKKEGGAFQSRRDGGRCSGPYFIAKCSTT